MSPRAVAIALAIAVSCAASARAEDEFTRVPALEPNVAFWHKVYIEWSMNQIALHDDEDMGLVYRVFDVPGHGEKNKAGQTRPDVIHKAQADVEAALKSLAKKNPKDASGLTG
ncbi:MAG TPA: hypothetical protein VGO62_06605, partial [Myxococcota bacterium]